MEKLEPVCVYTSKLVDVSSFLMLERLIESVAVVTGMLCVGRLQRRSELQRGEASILERDNGQEVLLIDTMALCLLFGAWRIFVPNCSLIDFVETKASDLRVHTIVHSFDTMNFCRILMMVATASGAESRIAQHVEGRSEGEDAEGS